MNKIEAEILIVGGGAAGLAAAAASDKNAVIVDDNPLLGGQIWRSEMGKIKSPDARRLIDAIESKKIAILNSTTVFGLNGTNGLLAESRDGVTLLNYQNLIVATGARERLLPFPVWTLPGVFGAGGLQALVKSGLSVKEKRIVVAGSGPLLLAVAEYLKSKGANICAIVEQTSAARLRKFGLGLWRTPAKLSQAISMRFKLLGIKYLTDAFITSADGNPQIQAVTILRKGRRMKVECDYLACGFHLVPNIELATLLGCQIDNGFVTVDQYQQTSMENVYCAGEPTGIGGVESSLIEGKIAGLAAAGNLREAANYFRERAKANDFASRLNRAFELRDELRHLAKPETIVCRCEDVTFERLKSHGNWREAKLQTRCGMGACQGRVCGAATEFLFDWRVDPARPPIFPVRMESLGLFEESIDEV